MNEWMALSQQLVLGNACDGLTRAIFLLGWCGPSYRYATRAKNIVNKPTLLIDPEKRLKADLMREVKQLRADNARLCRQIETLGAVPCTISGESPQASPHGGGGGAGGRQRQSFPSYQQHQQQHSPACVTNGGPRQQTHFPSKRNLLPIFSTLPNPTKTVSFCSHFALQFFC